MNTNEMKTKKERSMWNVIANVESRKEMTVTFFIFLLALMRVISYSRVLLFFRVFRGYTLSLIRGNSCAFVVPLSYFTVDEKVAYTLFLF